MLAILHYTDFREIRNPQIRIKNMGAEGLEPSRS